MLVMLFLMFCDWQTNRWPTIQPERENIQINSNDNRAWQQTDIQMCSSRTSASDTKKRCSICMLSYGISRRSTKEPFVWLHCCACACVRACACVQGSRSFSVTYTYRMCSEMKKWQRPAECAKEHYNTRQITRISTIFTVFTAKRAAGKRNLNK